MNVNVPSKVAAPAVSPPEGALGDDEQAAAQPSSRSAPVRPVIDGTVQA
jgi:hypothetical protein